MAKIKFRRDTAAAWTQANPTLAQGEPGFEYDTGLLKIGDGETPWNGLGYSSGSAASLTNEGAVVITAGSTEHWIATQRRNEYNTEPRGLRYDSLGNLYSLTESDSDEGSVAIITKYTAAGSVAWQKSFTGSVPLTLAVDSSNSVYIAVQSGDPIITLVKFSTTGDVLLKKNYDIGEVPAFNAFIEEKSSTTLAMAVTASNSGTDFAVIMEINSTTGAVEIKRRLDADISDVTVTGIDVDGDENVFVTGYYRDSGDDTDKMFIEKLDEDLESVWSKSLETPSGYDMHGGDCASDALGNIYAVGAFEIPAMNSNSDIAGTQSAGILTKLNSSGVVQWTRRLGPGPCGSFVTGLTATDTGNVYLSAVTFVKNTQGQFAEYPEYVQEAGGQNKMIVVRYDTQGVVVWQRYVDVVNLFENYNTQQNKGQAIAVFGDKFAVDGYGRSSNTTPYAFGSVADVEDDYFAVQLPTDGTALTIGNLDFVESRIPARFITQVVIDSPLSNSAFAQTAPLVESLIAVDTGTRIANNIVISETYDYTFGADGTFSIPNDGDLQLTQTQVGYLMAVGGSQNYNENIYSRAVTVDSQGNMYLTGNEENDNQPFVMKINSSGVRQWSLRIEEDINSNDGRANGIAIHPTTGNVMVVCEMYGDSYDYSILVIIDQDTGRILDHEKFSDVDSDVYLNDIAFSSSGTYVMAGSKNGQFSAEDTVTAQTGSTTGTIVILRSDISGNASNSWQIGGTGISPFENIAYVERYTGLTGTVRQGSSATFAVTIGEDSSITGLAVANSGTNYLPGHKIVLDRTDFEMPEGTDIVITVTLVNSGGSIEGAIPTYSSTGTTGTAVQGIYTDITGTNYQTGSGLTFDFEGPRNSTNYDYYNNYNITAGGTNYVENDIIVISGTSLGGTTPANDLTLTVSADAGGVVNFNTLSGTAQTSTWKLETTTQVDFASTGSWAITYPLSRENFLVTPTWQRTFGTASNDTDRLYAVAVDSSNNIIAVGQGFGLLSQNNTDDLAMVYKFNSAGTLQWARQLNEKDSDCYAKSVTTIGTDIYVTHDSNDDGETVVTKLDSTGTVKWQRITDSSDDSVVARTQNGNILVTAEAYNEDIDTTALKVFLLTPSGETVYKRWLHGATDESTQFKNGRCLAADADSYYITAYFYGNDYTSSLAARLPVDGSGTGDYGSFRYTDVNVDTGTFFNGNSLTGVNYNISEVDLADANNYAGVLANGADPYVNTGTTVTVSAGDFYVNSFYPDLTIETVRDTDGGSIVFPDGTKQNTSATDIPQRRYTGQRYTLGLKDRGHHILCEESNDNITIPYNARVEFPVGAVITIVNTSGGSVSINKEGGSVGLTLAGTGDVNTVTLAATGMATLLKIGPDQWIISGNVT